MRKYKVSFDLLPARYPKGCFILLVYLSCRPPSQGKSFIQDSRCEQVVRFPRHTGESRCPVSSESLDSGIHRNDRTGSTTFFLRYDNCCCPLKGQPLHQVIDKPGVIELLHPVQIPKDERVQTFCSGVFDGRNLVGVGDRLRRRVRANLEAAHYRIEAPFKLAIVIELHACLQLLRQLSKGVLTSNCQ